jgi:hypothetical protein
MIGDHRVVPLYLMAGLFGALIYLITAPLLHIEYSYAYGASASVMGFVMASGLLAPNYLMHLLLIGEVKLKYVVIALIFLDLIGIAGLDNTGGRMAHLGGVAFGWIYILLLRQGRDLSAPVNQFFDWVSGLFAGNRRKVRRHRPTQVFARHSSVGTSRRRHSEVASTTAGSQSQVRENRNLGKDHQERLDAILDKIKQKGYDSLSAEEKEFLFLASKK